MNALSCGIRILAQFSFVLAQFTRLTDGRTFRRRRKFMRTWSSIKHESEVQN